MKYFKQLDFLRFIAVSLVIMQHWFHWDTLIGVDLGRIGVLIFFTLSGFLISGILLDNKVSIDNKSASLGSVLKTFYIRRLLRIAPIYYILILFLFVFAYEGIREKFWWYVLYGSNIYTYMHQAWDGMIGPFWSLAVEEQFYLFWPIALLLIPAKRIYTFLKFSAFIGPFIRLLSMYIALKSLSNVDISLSSIVLMPSCIDCFAWGGLLAYGMKKKLNWLTYLQSLRNLAIIFLLAVIIVLLKTDIIVEMFYPTVVSVLTVFLISRLVKGVDGISGKMIGNSFLLYLGKISYGIYLYHGPFPLIMGTVDYLLLKVKLNFSVFEGTLNQPPLVKYSIWVALLILICTVSYYCIEKPFNKLKDRFLYARA